MNLKRIGEVIAAFVFGGVIYGAVETLWRGYTHPTMLFVGGVCFSVIYLIDRHRESLSLWRRAVLGAAVITSAELVSGCIFNLWLGLGVWDYSRQAFNFLGQICALYTFLWALLSIPAFWLCRVLHIALENKIIYQNSDSDSASSS